MPTGIAHFWQGLPRATPRVLIVYLKVLGASLMSLAGCQIAWDMPCPCRLCVRPSLSSRPQCRPGDGHPHQGGNLEKRGRLIGFGATPPRAHISVPIGPDPLRAMPVGAFLDLLHGCGAWGRWRCDARNAEQNITTYSVVMFCFRRQRFATWPGARPRSVPKAVFAPQCQMRPQWQRDRGRWQG